MTKNEFIEALRGRLSGLSQCDIAERLRFYSEMIDDRIEDGLSEEEAVADIGTADDIAGQILSDIQMSSIGCEPSEGQNHVRAGNTPKKRRERRTMVLLAVGSPVWISLILAAFAVTVSIYASLWAVIISLWASFGAMAVSALGGITAGTALSIMGNCTSGLALISAALVVGGLSIFLFFGCLAATKGTARLSGMLADRIKNIFSKKEGA